MRLTEQEYEAMVKRHPASKKLANLVTDQVPKPVHVAGSMNKTEERYAQHVLDPLLMTKEILAWRFEPVTFRLADRTRYTPDFLVVYPDRFELHEIKGGFIREDAMVKYKVAKSMYPWFVWKLCQWKKGEWIIT